MTPKYDASRLQQLLASFLLPTLRPGCKVASFEDYWLSQCLSLPSENEAEEGNPWAIGLAHLLRPDEFALPEGLPSVYARLADIRRRFDESNGEAMLEELDAVTDRDFEGITEPELRKGFESLLEFFRTAAEVFTLANADNAPQRLLDAPFHERILRLELDENPEIASILARSHSYFLCNVRSGKLQTDPEDPQAALRNILPFVRRWLSPDFRAWIVGKPWMRVALADGIFHLLACADDEAMRRTAADWIRTDSRHCFGKVSQHVRQTAASYLLLSQCGDFNLTDALPEADRLREDELPEKTDFLRLLDRTRRRAYLPNTEGMTPGEALRILSSESAELQSRLSDFENHAVELFSERIRFESALSRALGRGFGNATATDRREILKCLNTAKRPDKLSIPCLVLRYLACHDLGLLLPAFGMTSAEWERLAKYVGRLTETFISSARNGITPLGLGSYCNLLTDLSKAETERVLEGLRSASGQDLRIVVSPDEPIGSLHKVENAERYLPDELRSKRENVLTKSGTVERFLESCYRVLAGLRFLTDEVLEQIPDIPRPIAHELRTKAEEFERTRHSLRGTARRRFLNSFFGSVLMAGTHSNNEIIKNPVRVVKLLLTNELFDALVLEPHEAALKRITLENIGTPLTQGIRAAALRMLEEETNHERTTGRMFSAPLTKAVLALSDGILSDEGNGECPLAVTSGKGDFDYALTGGLAQHAARRMRKEGRARFRRLNELLMLLPKGLPHLPSPYCNLVEEQWLDFLMAACVQYSVEKASAFHDGHAAEFKDRAQTASAFPGCVFVAPAALKATEPLENAKGSLMVDGKTVPVDLRIAVPLFEEEIRYVRLFGWEALKRAVGEKRLAVFNPDRDRPLQQFFTSDGLDSETLVGEPLPEALARTPCLLSRLVSVGREPVEVLLRTNLTEDGAGSGAWIVSPGLAGNSIADLGRQAFDEEASVRTTLGRAIRSVPSIASLVRESNGSFAYLRRKDAEDFLPLEEAYASEDPHYTGNLRRVLLLRAVAELRGKYRSGNRTDLPYPEEFVKDLKRILTRIDPRGLVKTADLADALALRSALSGALTADV